MEWTGTTIYTKDDRTVVVTLPSIADIGDGETVPRFFCPRDLYAMCADIHTKTPIPRARAVVYGLFTAIAAELGHGTGYMETVLAALTGLVWQKEYVWFWAVNPVELDALALHADEMFKEESSVCVSAKLQDEMINLVFSIGVTLDQAKDLDATPSELGISPSAAMAALVAAHARWTSSIPADKQDIWDAALIPLHFKKMQEAVEDFAEAVRVSNKPNVRAFLETTRKQFDYKLLLHAYYALPNRSLSLSQTRQGQFEVSRMLREVIAFMPRMFQLHGASNVNALWPGPDPYAPMDHSLIKYVVKHGMDCKFFDNVKGNMLTAMVMSAIQKYERPTCRVFSKELSGLVQKIVEAFQHMSDSTYVHFIKFSHIMIMSSSVSYSRSDRLEGARIILRHVGASPRWLAKAVGPAYTTEFERGLYLLARELLFPPADIDTNRHAHAMIGAVDMLNNLVGGYENKETPFEMLKNVVGSANPSGGASSRSDGGLLPSTTAFLRELDRE